MWSYKLQHPVYDVTFELYYRCGWAWVVWNIRGDWAGGGDLYEVSDKAVEYGFIGDAAQHGLFDIYATMRR